MKAVVKGSWKVLVSRSDKILTRSSSSLYCDLVLDCLRGPGIQVFVHVFLISGEKILWRSW